MAMKNLQEGAQCLGCQRGGASDSFKQFYYPAKQIQGDIKVVVTSVPLTLNIQRLIKMRNLLLNHI